MKKKNKKNKTEKNDRYVKGGVFFFEKWRARESMNDGDGPEVRAEIRAMRDDGVYGSSHLPYLKLLRDILDTTGEGGDRSLAPSMLMIAATAFDSTLFLRLEPLVTND